MKEKTRLRIDSFGEEGFGFAYGLITRIIDDMSEDKALSSFIQSDLLFNMMGEKFKEEHKLIKLSEEIKELLEDDDKIREIKLYTKIKEEVMDSVNYYGIDRGDDERRIYNKDMEVAINELQARLRIAMGKIIRYELKDMIDAE